MEKEINVNAQAALWAKESEKKSLFGIEMCGEKLFFENMSGLDPAGLIKAYRKCKKPFIEMARYGRQISTEESAVIEQGKNFGFSIEFDDDNNEVRIFDGEKSEYMQLREREAEEIQEIPKAGRRR